MTRQVINVGATANDGTGDGLRSAYIKCNDNFNELYNSSITPTVLPNGTSNGSVAENANVTITIAGSANVVNFAGTVSEFTGNIDISTDLAVGNSVTITQDLTIGDQLIINGSFGSNVLPDTNNTRTLGNATLRFASMNTVLVDATGNITTTANISGANIITSGAHITTGNVTGGNVNTGGQVVATGNITGGNVITAGLVDVTGNVTGGNLNTGGVVIATGNVTAGGFLFGDGGFISNITAAANVAVTQIANGTSVVGIASSGGNVEITSGGVLTLQTDGTNVEFLVPLDFGSTNVVTTGNVSGGNVLASANVIATGNVSGTYILGDGSQLTGIDSAAISNGTSNVSVATNSDITMGVANSPITIVSATGLATTGIVSATGNVTATGNVAGGNVIATANVDAAKISTTGTIVAGGIVTGSQLHTTGLITDGTMQIQTGAFTSVATISAGGNITTTANVSGGNIVTAGRVVATGNVTATGNVNGGNVNGTTSVVGVTVLGTTLVNATGTAGSSSVVTGALRSAGGLGVAENIFAGGTINATGTITGTLVNALTMAVSGTGLSGSASYNNSGASTFTVTSNATNLNTGSTVVARDVSGNFSAGTITATLSGAATTAGTITSQANSATITAASTNTINQIVLRDGSGDFSAGTITATLNGAATTAGSATTAGTITSQANSATITAASTNTINQIVLRDGSGDFSAGIATLTATQARYADIAEQYLADQEYEPGTVVCIGGVYEITSCGPFNTPAGVISTDPALLMNSELNAGLPVALLGRVPVRVFGPVTKGQKVYADLHGRACRSSEGELIGIALEDNADEGEKLVECMLKL
jgi:hypothetical protein